jgi:hypothetical protein
MKRRLHNPEHFDPSTLLLSSTTMAPQTRKKKGRTALQPLPLLSTNVTEDKSPKERGKSSQK